jgi:3-methyladenine DNA glycosylase/8-oxoguanine DNA glycosylase
MNHLRQFDPAVACTYLAQRDQGLARIMAGVGDLQLEVRRNRSVFEYLCRSIVYQQLSGKAASTIHGRLLDLFPNRRVAPGQLLAMPVEHLRAAGLSRSKCIALVDLADRGAAGELPDTRALHAMSDELIIERLSEVRGVGEWTVQMLLIFYLGRADVLPIRDLGVLKGYQKMRRLATLPKPSRLARAGRRWQPYRSVATWYLWRCLDIELPTA